MKDDYISTLEYLVDCEKREIDGLRAFHPIGVEAYEKLHIGHVRSERRNKQKKDFYVKRFRYHHLEKGLNPFKAETAANRDVIKKFSKGYEKSSLYDFRSAELKKYFTERKRPLDN